jgi:hypothetical protein
VNEIAPQAPSVSTAQPSTYVDRRALSEAWFRALYDSHAGRGAAGPGARRPIVDPAGATAQLPPCRAAGRDGIGRETLSKPERVRARLIRAALAPQARTLVQKRRRTEAAQLATRKPVAKRMFCRAVIEKGAGVDLLVQQRGDILRLVAIYDGRDAERVAAALHAARAALERRGLRTAIDAIQKGSS